MPESKHKNTRRSFLKELGLLTSGLALPVFPGTGWKVAKVKTTGPLHRILSCNIRVALPEDEAKGFGWNRRREVCAGIIRKQHPDIVCLQETIRVQVDDLRNYFPDFTFFGFKGPEMDRFPSGYHWIAKNVIMYSEKRYELVSAGCYWLSETPYLGGSKSWGTARARHVNWIRIRDKSSSKEFRILDTHLDHISQDARMKQTELILSESGQYTGEFPQVLGGDFNSDSENPVIRMIIAQDWKDSWSEVHGTSDPGFTYHGFLGPDKPQETGANKKIDFIFSRGNIAVKRSGIIRDSMNGLYPSDHYFISADFELT